MARPRWSASKCGRAEWLAWRWAVRAPLALAAVCLGVEPASAHGFGQRYELPVPLMLYLYGAATTVLLSFVVFALFVRHTPTPRTSARVDPIAGPLGRFIGSSTVAMLFRLGALALFVVVILTGLVGEQNPYRNIAPTLVWIVWWVGFAYVSSFVGDLWQLVNPWRTIFDGVQWLFRRLGARHDLGMGLPYRETLGVWPAALLLLIFAWVELVYPNAASPAHIACLAIAYSLIAFAGMLAFGRDVWLRNGEVFSLVFTTFARFAPTEAEDGHLYLRPLGAGLRDARPVSASMMAFVLLLLATVLYDGLIGTGEWAAFEGWLLGGGERGAMALRSIGLVAVWLIFLGAYVGISGVMSWLAGGRPSALEVGRSFALTLVPIAIGYHVAHYLVFLLVQGQYIIPLLSDPFGYGWDLFGTAGYRVDIGIVGARFAWYVAIAAIVTGHVAAVYFAHVRAIAIFGTPGTALLTQVPLTALMVIYTFIGLSITAQPIVESRAAAEPVAEVSATIPIPRDAVLPVIGNGRLGPPTNGAARLKLTYKVLGSAFHDATKTTAADLLYAYAFAYRWSARASDGDPAYDPHIEAATAMLRRHLSAVRVVGAETASRSFRVGDVDFVREVFTVEVYLALTPDNADWNAVVAPPWSAVPWHLLVLMEEAVTRGWAAFSEREAQRRGIPWLDLVRSKELVARLLSLASEFERDAYRPYALQGSVTEEEARRRWRALIAFYKANGHFLVTSGPYKLKSWTGESVTLEAFRDLTYPLGVGSYDSYAIPRRGFITSVQWDGARLTVAGDIEVVEKFGRSYRLVRTPLKAVPAAFLKRDGLELRYVVISADGRVALTGLVPIGADATFALDLKGRLPPPGTYTLSAYIAVSGNAMNAEIHRVPLIIETKQ
jgi:hypothetical protein